MRVVTLPPIPDDPQEKLEWCVQAIQEIANASVEDAIEVFDSYSNNSTPTVTRSLNVSAPSTSNLAAVIGTLIDDLKRRGVNRST